MSLDGLANPVFFTGPISQYLNPILAQASEAIPMRKRTVSPLQGNAEKSSRPKDSPERQKAPPKPTSPPRLYTAVRSAPLPVGTIISRRQLQMVSVDTLTTIPVFHLGHECNSAALQALSQLSGETREAEDTIGRWAGLAETSAFECGYGKVLRRQDLEEVMGRIYGQDRVEALQAANLLAKVKVAPLFSKLQAEKGKWTQTREEYYQKLKGFMVVQSRKKRDIGKSSNIETPFLVPGPGIEESKHLSCLRKGKPTRSQPRPEAKPSPSPANTEFQLEIMRNIYHKQLLKVTFQALNLHTQVLSQVKGKTEEVQEAALRKVAYLVVAGWVHVLLTKNERQNMLQTAQERLTALRKINVLQALNRYSKRKERKAEWEIVAENHRKMTVLRSSWLAWEQDAVVRKRKQVQKDMSGQHFRLCLLYRAFSELKRYIVSTMIIKEKITLTSRVHSPASTYGNDNFVSVYQDRMEDYSHKLNNLIPPSLPLSKPFKHHVNWQGKTLGTAKLLPLSPTQSDPVLAKYLTATFHSDSAEPQAQRLEAHKRYAEHLKRYNPSELDPPDQPQTADYWPVDVGLIATPISPLTKDPPEAESTMTNMEDSIVSLPYIDFHVDAKPILNKEALAVQIRSLWLLYRTLKRVGPTYHTLKARRRANTAQPDSLINTFIQSRRTSKFFTNWKKAFLVKSLLQHLEVFSGVKSTQICLAKLRLITAKSHELDSQASSFFEYRLKERALSRWTRAGKVPDKVLIRFRKSKVLRAWKQHQIMIAEKLVHRIKARKSYYHRLMRKAYTTFTRYWNVKVKERTFSVKRTVGTMWRQWKGLTRSRQLLRRVIAQGLENYKDSIVEELRSEANFLTSVLQGWKKTCCKKRKSRERQIQSLTASNWYNQRTKVRSFFHWKGRFRLLKGLHLLRNYWKTPCKLGFSMWKAACAERKIEENNVDQYRKGWVLQRVFEKWSEWVLQEKIVAAVITRKCIKYWRVAIYQLKYFPQNAHKRLVLKTIFGKWKREWLQKVRENDREMRLKGYLEGRKVRAKRRILELLITNFILRSKSERLKNAEKRACLKVHFHAFVRKEKKIIARNRENRGLYERLKTFRLHSKQRINPKVRLEYLNRSFSLWLRHYSQVKSVLSRLIQPFLQRSKGAFLLLFEVSKLRNLGTESLRSSTKQAEFDLLFQSLEDTYLKTSLYRDTRTRKVHFEGEIDTSSVGPKVKDICEGMQETWLERYQRQEQEKRAEIHKELDSLQASLMSSLSSRGSKRHFS